MPEISVIVPVYNSEKYLKRCVDSILVQTFENFELILVDDGSTDGSSELCDVLAENDSRIYVLHQKNQGQAGARNRGVKAARADWIHFVDSDDLIHPQMLEILYKPVKENGVKISMCSAIEAKEVPSNFYDRVASEYDIKEITPKVLNELYECKVSYYYWIVCGKIIHKELVEEMPFAVGRIYEDNAVMCKWLYYAEKVAVCEEKLYFYYINDHGTTKSEYSLKHMDWLWALEQQMSFYRKRKCRIMYKAVCIRYMFEAADEYRYICNSKKNKTIAYGLKIKMIWIHLIHWRNIELTRGQIGYIYSIICPKELEIVRSLKNMRKKLLRGKNL